MASFPDYPPTVPNVAHRLAASFGALKQVIEEARSATFADIERASASIARGLLARGAAKGSRIGLLAPNGVDWVAAWFAITRIGAIAVQMSTFAKPREIAHVLRHADVSILLTADAYLNHNYVERLETAFPELTAADGRHPLRMVGAPYLREIWMFGEARPHWARGLIKDLEHEAEVGSVSPALLAAVEREVHPSDFAVMIYTSGSTSEPKAVVHTHGSVVRHGYVMSQYTTLERGDRLIAAVPLFWVGGLCWSLLTSSFNGAALVVPKSQDVKDVAYMHRAHKVTHSIGAMRAKPALLAAGMSEEDFARLRPLSSEYLAAYGGATPETNANALGMSETFGPHSMEAPGTVLPIGKTGSFARAVMDIERKIVDPATGATLPPGDRGELCVRGYSLMAGYYKKEKSEAFDPDGWFHTGDQCSLDEDGYLFFHGRLTEMLKSSGTNVAPREVELVLYARPEVQEVAVIGVPDEKLGQMVVAAIILKQPGAIDETRLHAWLHEQLSGYKVPKRIVFLKDDEMPRTDTGKAHKPSLVALIQARLNAERSF
jgi:acyl-CoA synthetase (AMP-forming)/AMP-acid ligase II